MKMTLRDFSLSIAKFERTNGREPCLIFAIFSSDLHVTLTLLCFFDMLTCSLVKPEIKKSCFIFIVLCYR